MSQKIIIWHEKHGNRVTTASPEAFLQVFNERYKDGYWYENWEEGNPMTEWGDRAKVIHDAQDEKAAQRFLYERQEHEYEGFEEQVIS